MADACDDSFLGGTANQLVDVGSHGHASAGFQQNSVACHRIKRHLTFASIRAIDHFRIDAGSDGFENITTGEVNCLSGLPVEIDVRAIRRDESPDHIGDVTTSEIV